MSSILLKGEQKILMLLIGYMTYENGSKSSKAFNTLGQTGNQTHVLTYWPNNNYKTMTNTYIMLVSQM